MSSEDSSKRDGSTLQARPWGRRGAPGRETVEVRRKGGSRAEGVVRRVRGRTESGFLRWYIGDDEGVVRVSALWRSEREKKRERGREREKRGDEADKKKRLVAASVTPTAVRRILQTIKKKCAIQSEQREREKERRREGEKERRGEGERTTTTTSPSA